MDTSGRKSWIRRVILVGVIYAVVGVVLGTLANPAVSDQVRFMWRLAAWLISAAVYAAHIAYEYFRLGSSSRAIALHVAIAAGLGAFLLAAAATVHAMMVPSHAPYWLFFIALLVWPIITGLPAFLVALVVVAVLTRLPKQNEALETEKHR